MQNAPKYTKHLMHKSLVFPIIDYASTMWSPYRQYNLIRLKAVQKKAAHFFFCRYDRCFSLSLALHELKLEPLSARCNVESFLHNITHLSYSNSNAAFLSFAQSSSIRNFHKLNLAIFFARTDAFKYTFFFWTLEIWKSLPGHIWSLPLNDYVTVLVENDYVTEAWFLYCYIFVLLLFCCYFSCIFSVAIFFLFCTV